MISAQHQIDRDQLFGLPLEVMSLQDVMKMPELHQQQGSLTPLEKFQLGILMTGIRPNVVVETGVWRGRTTRFIADFMTLNEIPGVVYGFDRPEIIGELLSGDPFFGSASNIKFIKGSLPDSLSVWLSGRKSQIDMALVDAHHSYYAVYKELSLLGPWMNPAGYIFCHDYGESGSKYEGVMCAVNDFSAKYGFSVLPLRSSNDSQGYKSCQAAILHRPVVCSRSRRLFHWRKYLAQNNPKIAEMWGSARTSIESLFNQASH
jgi:hypothetical protein